MTSILDHKKQIQQSILNSQSSGQLRNERLR